MAAGILSEPGTKYGPCPKPCTHLDCIATRADSERLCQLCGKPIGYGTRFYDTSSTTECRELSHADCAEDAADEISSAGVMP